MEYILFFILLLIIPLITNHLILPPSEILMMSPIEGTLAPYIVVGILIFMTTFLITMSRAVRTCGTTPDSKPSWGIYTGLKLGGLTTVFGCFAYYLIHVFQFLILPFISVSILPYASDIGQGFYVALGAYIGFLVGYPFIGIC